MISRPTLLLTAVATSFALTLVVLDHTHKPTPLQQLEERTRQIPALHTITVITDDDAWQMQTIELASVVRTVLGVQVNYIEMTDPNFIGWTAFDPKKPRAVNIDTHLHWTARFEVLAHEAGHRFEPAVFAAQTSESEVFAQAVSYLVCRAYGHDTLDSSAHYLAIHKGGLHVLRDYATEINYAVTVLMGGL